MAAHDPYWRLYESPSLPAPAYESPGEIEAALATVAVAAPSVDSAAERPGTSERSAEGAMPAELQPRPAEPVIAVPVALVPIGPDHGLTGGGDALAAQAGGNGSAGPLPVLALAPPPLLTPRLPAASPMIGSPEAPSPVAVAAAPAPLWVVADEASEEGLALARAERANVQRRLALAGFDPRGFDGVFGPRTRQAIADFQESWGFPATGYLDGAVVAELRARTEEAYVALASRAAAEPRAAPKIAPVARERQLAANDTGGCARDAQGRIIEHQNFGCDLKGLAEKVISLGRNRLPHEEGAVGEAAMAMAGSGAIAPRAATER